MCLKKNLLGIKLMKSFLVWYRAVSGSLVKLLFSFQHQLNYEYSQSLLVFLGTKFGGCRDVSVAKSTYRTEFRS